MREVELKLELDPAAQGKLRRLAALKGAARQRSALLALYFDTPDGELAAREMALRLRRSGRRWVQTLKGGRSGAGGLHSRDEWEYSAGAHPVLDLALFKDTPLAHLPHADKLHERLAEIFRVEVARTTWDLEIAPGTRVEVALDVGEVRHGTAHDLVCEVEIESKQGEPLAVFDFARRLVDAVPMRPSAVTKAQRGYRLLGGAPLAPVKAKRVKLDARMTVPEAARAMIGAGLEQIQANEEGALASDDPEFVHQLRVALRRMRSAMRAYRGALEPGFEAEVREDVRWITRLTGTARDLDVFATQTLPAIGGDGRELMERLEPARAQARAELRAGLRTSRYARLMLAFARLLAREDALAPHAGAKVGELASRTIRKHHRKLVRIAVGVAAMEPAERHRVRIAAKRLRYIVEGFASLFPAKAVEAYVESLSRLQGDLGDANDAAVATRLVAELGVAEPFASFARGWLEARAQASVGSLAAHFEKLESARHFWKGR